MNTITRVKLEKAIRDGKMEATSDETRTGMIEVRVTSNGKRMTLQIN